MPFTKSQMEWLQGEFRAALEGADVARREDVERTIAKAAEENLEPVDPHEAREWEADAAAEVAEETHAAFIDQLRDTLPADVWEVVSRHLAAADDPLPETDMVGMEPGGLEKDMADLRASAGPTLQKVRSELAASEPSEPSHEGTLEKGPSVSHIILSRFEELEPRPLTKSKDGEGSDNPALAMWEETDA